MLIFVILLIAVLLNIPLDNLFLVSIQNCVRWTVYIIGGFIIYTAVTNYFGTPLLCDSFTQDMNNGVIPRTRLLQPGQTIANIWDGTKEQQHRVTGGNVSVGRTEKGGVTKIIGVMVDNWQSAMTGYRQGNQPFNMNLAKVLYELRAAGKKQCSYSLLDYHTVSHYNSEYVRAFKASQGQSIASTASGFGEFYYIW